MSNLRSFFNEISQAVGFDRIEDLLISVTFIKQAFLGFYMVWVSILVTGCMFFENYIFEQKYTYIIALSSTALESVFGTIANIRVDKEKFSLQKALRLVPKVISHGVFLSFSWHMGEAEDVFLFLPTFLFIYMTGINFVKGLWHVSRIGWISKDVAEIMQNKLEGLKK